MCHRIQLNDTIIICLFTLLVHTSIHWIFTNTTYFIHTQLHTRLTELNLPAACFVQPFYSPHTRVSISMMNVLDVEGSRSRLLENSIASTLLFVYFAYVVRYIFVVAGLIHSMLLLLPGSLHICVCAALDNQHVRCILSVSAYLCRVYCVGVAGSFCLSFLFLTILGRFALRNTAAHLSLFVPNRLIISFPIFCQSLYVRPSFLFGGC